MTERVAEICLVIIMLAMTAFVVLCFALVIGYSFKL